MECDKEVKCDDCNYLKDCDLKENKIIKEIANKQISEEEE